MLRHSLALFVGTALVSLLSACTTGTTTTSGNPSPKGSSTSATEPAKDGGSSSGEGEGEGEGSLGPQCTAYIACCEEVAATTPAAAASCDSVKSQIENAEKNGVSAAQYEAGCKSGISTFKSAGYCK